MFAYALHKYNMDRITSAKSLRLLSEARDKAFKIRNGSLTSSMPNIHVTQKHLNVLRTSPAISRSYLRKGYRLKRALKGSNTHGFPIIKSLVKPARSLRAKKIKVFRKNRRFKRVL